MKTNFEEMLEKISREAHPIMWAEIDAFAKHPPGTELALAAKSMRFSALREATRYVEVTLGWYSRAEHISEDMTEGAWQKGTHGHTLRFQLSAGIEEERQKLIQWRHNRNDTKSGKAED